LDARRPMNQESDDKILLGSVLSGDGAAAELLVRRFSNLVYSSIIGTLRTRHVDPVLEDVADLHNTVFLRLLERNCRKLRQFQGRNGCSLGSWIRIVTVRIVLNTLRDRGFDGLSAGRRKVALEEIAQPASANPGALDRMEAAETWNRLEKAMELLSDRERLLFRMHFDEGLDLPEVAEALRITVGNAYTIKHRAIKALKAAVHKSHTS